MTKKKAKCETCNKTFETTQGLASHRRQRHEGKPNAGNPQIASETQAKTFIQTIERPGGLPMHRGSEIHHPATAGCKPTVCTWDPMTALKPEVQQIIKSQGLPETQEKGLAWHMLEHCLRAGTCPDAEHHLDRLTDDYKTRMGLIKS